MSEKREILLDIQVNQRQAQKRLAEIEKQLIANRKEQARLTKVIKEGGEESDQAAQELVKLKTETAGLRTESRSLSRQLQNQEKASNEAEGSLEQLKAQVALLRQEYNRLSREERETTEAGQRLTAQLRDLTEELRANESAVGDDRRNVGNYKSALDDLGGALDNAIPGFAGIRQGIASISSLGPAAVFGAIAAGVGAAAKAVIDLTKEFGRLRDEVNEVTGATGDDLNRLTGEIQGIAATFDVDFQEVLQAANATAKQFGVTTDEALAQISEGFINGANASGQYLDQLREYPAQLASVGLSLEEANALILQQTQEGIFSDKGVDAIKEAGIRLRELTPATREALQGIGLSAEEIETQLREGTVSLFDVIGQVSNRLDELPEQSTEVGTAIADIFGGPGEDAGIQYLRTLGRVEGGLDNVSRASDEVTSRQRAQLEATQRLSTAKAELAARFQGAVAAGETFLTNVTAGLLDAFGVLLDVFQPLIDAFGNVIGLFTQGGDAADEAADKVGFLETAFNVLLIPLRIAINVLSVVVETIGSFVAWVSDAIAETSLFQGALSALTPVFSFLGDIINNTSAAIEGISASFDQFVENIQRRAQILAIDLELLARRIQGFFDDSADVQATIQRLESQKEELSAAGRTLGEAYQEAFNEAVAEKQEETPAPIPSPAAAAPAQRRSSAPAAVASQAPTPEQVREEQAKVEEARLAEIREAVEERIRIQELAQLRLEEVRQSGLVAEEKLAQRELEIQKELVRQRAELELIGVEENSSQAQLIIAQRNNEIRQLEQQLTQDIIAQQDARTMSLEEEGRQQLNVVARNLEQEEQLRREAAQREEELERAVQGAIGEIQNAAAAGDLVRIAEITDFLVESFQDAGLESGQKFAAGLAAGAGAVAGVLQQVNELIEVTDRESAERARKVQIAQLIFSGISSAAQALFGAITTLGPIAGPIVGGAQAALIGAITAAQVNRLRNEPLQFARGGLVEGPSHSEGGVPFTVQGQGGYEMEGGEFVVNRVATERYRPCARSISKGD